jgi:hypothetical protein
METQGLSLIHQRPVKGLPTAACEIGSLLMKVNQDLYEPMAAGQRGPGCQIGQEMARGHSKQLEAVAEVSICPRIAQWGPAF